MSQDNTVIRYITPAELAVLMGETGMITVHETGEADGKPVIHAALKVVNAQTGEQMPDGLPFSVVMFKSAGEPGYSNIAIGAIVPAAELEISLPRDYFNFCNQRFRFTRAFPLDDSSFALQMDLFVRNATREYVKYNFGIWATMFSQVLFELVGRGKTSLVAAAEAYAAAHTDLSQQYVSAVTTSDAPATDETAVAEVPEAPAEEVPAAETPVVEPVAEPASEPEVKLEETPEMAAGPEPAPEPVEVKTEPVDEAKAAAEPVAELVDAVTGVPAVEPAAVTAGDAAAEPAGHPAELKEPVAA